MSKCQCKKNSLILDEKLALFNLYCLGGKKASTFLSLKTPYPCQKKLAVKEKSCLMVRSSLPALLCCTLSVLWSLLPHPSHPSSIYSALFFCLCFCVAATLLFSVPALVLLSSSFLICSAPYLSNACLYLYCLRRLDHMVC